VPYGIETIPYAIETVPYGNEMIPYGIETIPYGMVLIPYGNNSIFGGFEGESYRKVGRKAGYSGLLPYI
jgi:hypothetical protein